jgi:hypothetical protein
MSQLSANGGYGISDTGDGAVDSDVFELHDGHEDEQRFRVVQPLDPDSVFGLVYNKEQLDCLSKSRF